MNATRLLESKTAEERQAVKDGDVVWFSFEPWHHAQSGYKVCTYWAGGSRWDSREPTAAELAQINATQEVV